MGRRELVFGSGRTKLGLSRSGFSVVSIVDRQADRDWVLAGMPGSIFRLSGLDRRRERREISSSDGTSACLGQSPDRVLLGFDLPASAKAVVEAREGSDGTICLHLRIQEMGELSRIEHVDFPCLCNLAVPEEKPYLAFPFEQGILVRDPVNAIFRNPGTSFRLRGSYPGNYSMQFLVFGAEGGPGLYLASHDAEGHVKDFSVERDGLGGVSFTLRHHLADPSRAAGLPYPAVIGTYDGTWLDGSRIYRSWALSQAWCNRGKLSTGSVPAWLQSIPGWIWNRGRAAQVVKPAIALSGYLSLPVAVDWYWWHGNPYDTMLPDYLPPRDGPEAFKAALEELHRHGLRCIHYINGRCCDPRSEAWREGEAVVDSTGQVKIETYCRYTKAGLGVVCPASDYWGDVISEIAAELLRYGSDGVYVDQIASAPPRICNSGSHGHPPGGGAVWAEGNRSVLRRSRDAVRIENSDAMLCSEGCCEVYLDLLDAFLTLSPSYERMGMFRSLGDSWEPIPMFNSVYHEFVVTFGSYASLAPPPYDELWPIRAPAEAGDFTRFADQFDLEMARCLVFGQKPMVANFDPSQADNARFAASLEFFRDVCLLHSLLGDHLVRGAYLGPASVPGSLTGVLCTRRGIYTLPEEADTVVRNVPAVLGSVWEAPDGSLVAVYANISHEAHPVDVSFLGAPGSSLTCIEPEGGRCILRTTRPGEHRIHGKSVLGFRKAPEV